MKSKFFLILSVILTIGVLIVLGYRENGVKLLPSYRTSSMQKLHLTHKEGNNVRWELMAQDATFPEGSKEIFINSLELKIHNDPAVYLTGGSGIYTIDNGDLTINKPVEVTIKDAKLTTNTLKWNSQEESITTKDNIKFSGKKFLIEGTGLAAETKHQKIMILKDVKGTFYL